MAIKSNEVLQNIFKKDPTFREMAAKSYFSRKVPASYPGGVFDCPMGKSVRIFTPTMKGSIWGEPEHITMSMLKTDVYDRRYFRRKPITLNEVVKGAFSEANKEYDDMPLSGLTRPKYGTLLESGGRFDAQAWSECYPFPCQKSVGQIIVLASDLKGARQPEAVQSMKDGTAQIQLEQGAAKLNLNYLMSMTSNIVAVDCEYENLETPLSVRLYRHQDQGHRRYMDESGRFIPKEERAVVYHPVNPTEPVLYYDYEGDAWFNGPFAPPTCGCDGRFFWVEQVFPKDETFKEGFRYVMMGMVSDENAFVDCQELQKNLGTAQRMPRNSLGKLILPGSTIGHDGELEKMEQAFSLVRNAPGVSGTAKLFAAKSGRVKIYVTTVTVIESEDYFALAKQQLINAEKLGYERLRQQNEEWYNDLYSRRENGRIFLGDLRNQKQTAERTLLDNAYLSWSYGHGGYCAPDPSKLQGGAGYAAFDVDTQSWHSLPCYNELFTEGKWFVHNQYEAMYMWPQLVNYWKAALKQKANDIYGLPGLIMGHGYLPPVHPDPWYIENQTLDFCMEVPGQVMKVIWNLWDYTGDESYLKETAYPLLRELAIFYEAFARMNYDGIYYHIAPTVETESYGIAYQLKYSKDTTGAIAIFRKILNLASEAAAYLGVDADLIAGWKEVAQNLPPYPTFEVGMGKIFAGNPGAMPRWQAGDHEINSGIYPAVLADEINLDSSSSEKELIIRTADTVRTNWNNGAYITVGRFAEEIPCKYNMPAIPIADEAMLAKEVLDEPERLLNSRSGRIHLFPAAPAWAEISFRNMLARGGFEVSASKNSNGVQAVIITSRRSVQCKLMNPWPNEAVIITDLADTTEIHYKLETDNGQCMVFSAEAGHCYSIDIP